MAPKIGFDNKLYYNSGTHASPTWVLIGDIGDLNIPDLRRTMARVSLRSSRWPANIPAEKEFSIDFSMLYQPANAVFAALRTAFFADTAAAATLEFFVADGLAATVGTTGLRAGCVIENFPLTQRLMEANMVDTVRLLPGWYEEGGVRVEPDWYVVAV
jgi:hypothetical protein